MAIQPNGSRRPFFWVHGDHSFAVLPNYLGPDQPLHGLEHQSQDGHPATHTRVEDIAAHYLREVRSAHARGPYLLGGFSFGAVVAFEMAQQLRRAGEQVDVLFLLDSAWEKTSSTRPRPPPPTCGGICVTSLHEVLPARSRSVAQNKRPRVRAPRRASRQTRQHAAREALPLDGSPAASIAPQSVHLGVYAQALRAYVPQPYPGPATVMKAGEAPYKPRLDWAKLTTTEPRMLHVNGNHMDLRKEPHVGQWAEILKELLDRRQSVSRATMVNRVAQDVVN